MRRPLPTSHRLQVEGAQAAGPAGVCYAATTEELGQALSSADVLFIWDFRSTRLQMVWERAQQLRWVHIASAGIDPLLFPDFVASDVILTNSRHVFDDAIAEYVLGLLLTLAKDLACTLDLQRRRTWRHRVTYPFNLTQQPAASVPCGFTSGGLPIGLQLVGAKYADDVVLQAAHAYQVAHPSPTGGHQRSSRRVH
jgi:Asp-tRNA(Asn)/Glu-tRNA(Gln) amidotransferase A subunit family amidase